MSLNDDENKIFRIFAKHYGSEDAHEIETCIKGIIQGEQKYEERLVNVFIKNAWSPEDAKSFVDALKG